MYNIIHVENLTRFCFIKKINNFNDPYYTDIVALRSDCADSQADRSYTARICPKPMCSFVALNHVS